MALEVSITGNVGNVGRKVVPFMRGEDKEQTENLWSSYVEDAQHWGENGKKYDALEL